MSALNFLACMCQTKKDALTILLAKWEGGVGVGWKGGYHFKILGHHPFRFSTKIINLCCGHAPKFLSLGPYTELCLEMNKARLSPFMYLGHTLLRGGGVCFWPTHFSRTPFFARKNFSDQFFIFVRGPGEGGPRSSRIWG